MKLPEPRDGDPGSPYRVSLVCLGNICRSPIAAVVLRQRLADAGLTTVTVDSAGLGDWHVGHRMDSRSAGVLRAAGYDENDIDGHRARQFQREWLAGRDLVLGMDDSNLSALRRLAAPGERERIGLFGWFGADGGDIPDPYDADGQAFDLVLDLVEDAATKLSDELARLLDHRERATGN
ncbi:low molecular weight phosphotyrosine protein phosphatase [Actinopolymorpha pittospori]|uniref:protein-tyrosine-phosphatase n=1 Tax=Actinopolymorpha pittospori TaxID=648752 RepID=A0A927MXT3_9ACTN|nr:protein-tyrosine phosphatase [Actinopolymorpha pittospori]